MHRKSILLGAIVMIGLGTPALAHPGADGSDSSDLGDQILAPPPTYKANDVTVHEHLGATVPGEVQFRTQDGKLVHLADVLAGDIPTILTFNYSDCPMLCSLQLNGLSAVLPELAKKAPIAGAEKDVGFGLGVQFRIVTIDLSPTEPLDKMLKMRARYVDRLPEKLRANATAGWTFLVAATRGDAAAIGRVADAVGFTYTYLPERAEYAHPAALIFLSTTGVVTRYVYGIDFPLAVMRESIFKAGLAEPASAVGFMNRCYHFDPDANTATHTSVTLLRVAAAGFVVLLLAGFGLLHFMRKNS
jgi:protein SCO1/2